MEMEKQRISPCKTKTTRPVSENEYSPSEDDSKVFVKNPIRKKKRSKRTVDKKIESYAESSSIDSSSEDKISVISKNREEKKRGKNQFFNKNDSTLSKGGKELKKAADLNLWDASSDDISTPAKNQKEKNTRSISNKTIDSLLSQNNIRSCSVRIKRLQSMVSKSTEKCPPGSSPRKQRHINAESHAEDFSSEKDSAQKKHDAKKKVTSTRKQFEHYPIKKKSYVESSERQSSSDEEDSLPAKNRDKKNRQTLSSEESDSNASKNQTEKAKILGRRKTPDSDIVKTSQSKTNNDKVTRKQSDRSPRKKVKSYVESSKSHSSSDEEYSLPAKNRDTKNRQIFLSQNNIRFCSVRIKRLQSMVSESTEKSPSGSSPRKQRNINAESHAEDFTPENDSPKKKYNNKTKVLSTTGKQSERSPIKKKSCAESSESQSSSDEEDSLPAKNRDKKNRPTLSSGESDSNASKNQREKANILRRRKTPDSDTVKTSCSKTKTDKVTRKQSENSPRKKVKSYVESSESHSSSGEEYSLPTKNRGINRVTQSSEESDSNSAKDQKKKISGQRKSLRARSIDTVKTSPSKTKYDTGAISKQSERSPSKKGKFYAESSESHSSSDKEDDFSKTNPDTMNRATQSSEESDSNSAKDQSKKISVKRKAPGSSDSIKKSHFKTKNDIDSTRKQSDRSPRKKLKSYVESSESHSSLDEDDSLPAKNRDTKNSPTLFSEETDSNILKDQLKKARISERRKASDFDTVKSSRSKTINDKSAIKHFGRSPRKRGKFYAESSGSHSSPEDSLKTKNQGTKNRVT